MRSFELSKDPAFATKLWDKVGLYIDRPAHAVVLSADESWAAARTNQIQVLDRTHHSPHADDPSAKQRRPVGR